MNPNKEILARRDLATATLMGAVARGAVFGSEVALGAAFGNEYYNPSDRFGGDVAAEIAAEFGEEAGQKVQAALARSPHHGQMGMPHQDMQRAWHHMNRMYERSAERSVLLDPNRDSTIKVEHYELPLAEDIIIGTQHIFTALSTNPQTEFKPTSLVMNAPCAMFAFITDIKAANVSAHVSTFATDAYNFNSLATRSHVHLPKLLPQNTVSVQGYYSGLTPPGFLGGTTTTFTATFYGPSTMAGG
jgi:hypothetical protein